MKSDLLWIDELVSKLQSSELYVSVNSILFAKSLLVSAHKKHITSGRRPITLASSALYIACRIIGDDISQKNIGYVAGIPEVTIRTGYRLLMVRLGLVFPADELRNSRFKLTASKARLEKVVQIIDNCSKKIIELKAKAEPNFNEIKLITKVVKDLEAERDSLLLKTGKPAICPQCMNSIDEELSECPNCGWHPMPSCQEAYKTP